MIVARRLSPSKSTSGECLDKAESMFREMDLQWDPAELEKAR